MYNIQLDALKNFECTLKVQGTSLKKSKINLVIESEGIDIRCRGSIDDFGRVSIPIKRMKGILEENMTGNMYIEVIADDTYHTPFKTTYITEMSKKAEIIDEIKSVSVAPEKKATMIMDVKGLLPEGKAMAKEVKIHSINIIKKMMKENINIFKKDDKEKSALLIKEYIEKNNVDKSLYGQIIDKIMNGINKLI